MLRDEGDDGVLRPAAAKKGGEGPGSGGGGRGGGALRGEGDPQDGHLVSADARCAARRHHPSRRHPAAQLRYALLFLSFATLEHSRVFAFQELQHREPSCSWLIVGGLARGGAFGSARVSPGVV